MERPGGSQFGAGIQNTGGDHRHAEITRTAGRRVKDGVQTELAEGADHSSDMAVGKRPQDLERVGWRGNGGSAFENLAQRGDLLGRPVGDIGESAVVNFAVFAEGLAQQDGGRRAAVGDDRHVHVDMIARIIRNGKGIIIIYMTT
jgi:hypothetical protein